MFRVFSVSLLLVFVGLASAHAGEVNMGQVLLSEKGTPAPDPFEQTKEDQECAKCAPLTLGVAIAHALVAQQQDERDLDPLQKWARGVLAMKAREGQPMTLTAEETSVIKKLMGKLYGPVIVMQAFPLLDPSEKPPAVK